LKDNSIINYLFLKETFAFLVRVEITISGRSGEDKVEGSMFSAIEKGLF
jgi:hypothetical protein